VGVAASEPRKSRIITREALLSLYLPAMILALGSGLIAPALPFVARSFEVSFGEASLTIVVYGLGSLVSSLPTGFLIDHVGRRKVLLAGPLILAAMSVATAFAGSFEQLLVYRFLAGWAQQMWSVSRITVIADTGAESQRGRQIMGMVGMESAGRLLGPAVGGFLAAIDLRAPFLVHAALCLLAIAPSFFLIKESTPLPAMRRRGGAPSVGPAAVGTLATLMTVPVMMFMVAQLLANLTRGTSQSGTLHFYAAYAFNVEPTTIGLLASAASVITLPIVFSTGFIMDRFGRTATVVPGFTLTGLAMGVMAIVAFTDGPFSVYVPAFLALQFAQSLTSGNMQVIGTLIAPAHVRGRFFGVWRLAGEGGSALSPAIFALLAEHYSYGISFTFLSACALSAAFVLGTQVRPALKAMNATAASGRSAQAATPTA
jgi:MFS family permease